MEDEQDAYGEESDETTTSSTIRPKLKKEELPEVTAAPGKPALEAVVPVVEAYTDALYDFYEELLSNPGAMTKKMEKASVETNLDVLQLVY